MALTVAVIGYASSDRPVAVDSLPGPGTTAVVRERLGSPWPRLGGCGPQIAAGLAALGVETSCISWVGDDRAGSLLEAQLIEAGARVDGLDRGAERTPESFLVYDREGSSLCFFDPGTPAVTGLSEVQHGLVAAADVVCLSVAPAAATRAALDAAADGARIVWSVKADPDAYPDELAAELLARCAVVWHSEQEAGFVGGRVPGERIGPETLVIETRGAAGASWHRGGRAGSEPSSPLAVTDTTGAGDAFVAGSLAHLLDEPDDSAGAARAGIETSRALLEARARTEED